MHRTLILAIFVLSGAAGLVYEIVWSRQLVLVFGNTTQAVSAILTGFFGGMYSGDGYGEDVSGLTGMYGGGGTLDVTSVKPFVATVTGTNLTDQDHKSRHLSFTAGLSCDG